MGDSPRVCPSGLGQSRGQPGPGAPRRRPRGLRPLVLGAKALSLRQRKVERLMKGRERYIFPSLAKFEVFLYYPEFFFFEVLSLPSNHFPTFFLRNRFSLWLAFL